MRHRRCEATGELSVHWNQCGARRQARAAKVVTLPPPVTREMPSRPWAPGVKHEGLWQTRESTPRVVGIQRTAHPRSAICSNRKCTGRVAVDESDASRDCPIERGWSRRPGLTRDDHLVPARTSPRRRRASCIRGHRARARAHDRQRPHRRRFERVRLCRYGTPPRAEERERRGMSEAASGPVRFTGTSDEVIDWLRANGVERVRVEYGDYGGIARGKAMDVAHFERMMHHGVAFCATVMAFDIAGNVVPATDYGETNWLRRLPRQARPLKPPHPASRGRHGARDGHPHLARRAARGGRPPQRAAPCRRAHGGDGLRRPLCAGVRVLPPRRRTRDGGRRGAMLLDAKAHPVPRRGIFAAGRGRRPRGARMQPL